MDADLKIRLSKTADEGINQKFTNFDNSRALKRKEDHKAHEIKMADMLDQKKDLLKQLDRKTLVQKNRKWKNFDKMNEEEKRERIKYLWGRVRTRVRQIGMIKGVQTSLEQNFLDQFAQEMRYSVRGATNDGTYDLTDEGKLPYFLIQENSTKMKVWRLFLGLQLHYMLVYNMLYTSLAACHLMHFNTLQTVIFAIIEAFHLIDLVINFFVLP